MQIACAFCEALRIVLAEPNKHARWQKFAELVRSLDEWSLPADFAQRLKLLFKAMKAEWMKCPRCKNKKLKPELINTDLSGSDKLWWVCENYSECMFPLDMPSEIFHVTQTAYQKREGYIPLPDILNISQKYRFMYPVTFADSRLPSRCSSALSTKANSRNETSDSSSIISSEKSSGQNRLKAQDVHIGIASSSGSLPSEPREEHDNLDEEVAAASTKPSTVRTVRRKRYHDSTKSWASLIEKVASDPVAANRIINMEESELFKRMKQFFDDKYFKGTAICYKRPARRVVYRVDDVENCLREITQQEWTSAQERIGHMAVEARVAFQSASSVELLKSVGIDVAEMRKAVGKKVGNVMRGFSSESLAKRNKFTESRKIELSQKKAEQTHQIHQSVSARILNRMMKREDEERSLTSSPATSYYEPVPVSFHVGNEDVAPEQAQEPQYAEQDNNWNFDLNGLYESIQSQNQPHVDIEQDPMEAMLLSLDDGENTDEFHVESEGNRSPAQDDQYAGFDDDFNGDSFDFVNDNFSL
uniref:Uncharacterized protein n=1 Tax=Caenorhabditis japonica TaxID=281687 RepID=A0A8R1I2T5_CAEJA